MLTEGDIQRFIRKGFKWLIILLAVLSVLQIMISFWGNWNDCSNHYQDKAFGTTNECQGLKSVFINKACHTATHGLSLPPVLCGVYETVEDIRRIMWMDELKVLMSNLWFGILLAFVLGLGILYCALSRGYGGGRYPPISVVYPNDRWLQDFKNRNSQSQPNPSSMSLDIPGVTTPIRQTT